jgi:glycosyltransferase involved in cell wall biosynthesis
VLVHSYYVRDTRPRRHATALADAGWDVDVVCARERGESRRERRGRVRIVRLPAERRRGSKARYIFEYLSFTVLASLAVTWRSIVRKPDVVYVLGVPNFLVFAALVPRMLGAKVVLDMRDPMPEFFQSKYGVAPRGLFFRMLLWEEKLSARFATTVLTVHPSMADLYSRTGVPRENIAVVFNAPDPRMFASEAAADRDPSDRTMLYAGNVATWYGVDVAVRALGALKDEIPRLRLRIVGDGAQVPALRELAQSCGVGDRVAFERPVPLEVIPSIVRTAWVGVQPNRDDPLMRYSLSTKVLEWCRLQLPVICGETEPLVQLFAPDEVLFHAPGDLDGMIECIRRAHQDPEALAARAARARERVEGMRFEDEMTRLLDVFAR